MGKRARKKKSGGLWIHLFLVAFCVFVVAGVYWQYREYRQLKVELADVQQQIADEQQKTLDFSGKRITTTATATSNRLPEKNWGWSRAMKSVYQP